LRPVDFDISRRRLTRPLLALALAAAAWPRLASAQSFATAAEQTASARSRERARWGVAVADSLLRAGSIAYAEAYYYWASRVAPRAPTPRLALGRYLASRGALRVGAVLIEEARDFGASPALAALYLAPLYTQLGEWAKLARLDAVHSSERRRASWLVEHPPTLAGPDSVVVPLARSSASPLGALVLRLGGDSVIALIDPAAHGVTIDGTRRGSTGVQLFADDRAGEVGVIARAHLGDLELTNVPVRFTTLGGPLRARVGLDFLARFSPTVDGARGRMVLRRDGRVTPSPGDAYMVLLDAGAGARVAGEDGLVPVTELLGREPAPVSWTLDGRAGQLVMHRR
jgi:hypothetical protein